MADSEIRDGRTREGVIYKTDLRWTVVKAGVQIEDASDLMKALRLEIEESKKVMEVLANDIAALGDIVIPALLAQAKELRSSRMTVVTEVRESLNAMKDVRKFFVGPDYEVEMQRLERFVRLCREIQELKRSGIFDAVCDSAIRLAIKEEAPK